MISSLFAPMGRFREMNELLRKSKIKREKMMMLLLIVGLTFTNSAIAQDEHAGHNHEVDGHEHFEGDGHNHDQTEMQQAKVKAVHLIMSEAHSIELASLLVQDFDGRIIPMHTMCDQLIRKIYRGNEFNGKNAVQTVMSMHMYPDYWMDQKIISVPANLRDTLKVKGAYASYKELADINGEFRLMRDYQKAHQTLESKRNEFDKKLIKLVERFQVVQSIFAWQYMRIIPIKNDPNNTWFVPLSMDLLQKDTVSSTLALKYISGLDKAAKTNQYGELSDILVEFKKYQREVAAKVVPSESVVSIEISYNKMNIFKNSFRSYLLLGVLLLLIFFAKIFVNPSKKTSKNLSLVAKIVVALIVVIFVYHGTGLAFRWYISGHAPWSNGYEAVVFIAWATMIAGFAFSRKNPAILAGTAILAALMIYVTEMSLLDPEITPLQPVLKSYWLMIHVAIITASYGFLGLAAILGFFNLSLYAMRGKKNGKLVTLNINELTYVSEMTMTVGLFMLTIGTFLGGVWANESWGRYWGWDPKETWALVSVLVYAVILHLRMIPALKGKFLFNAVSLWGYSAIIFTFFGVNFYLVGLHSYAQGEGLGTIPPGVIIAVLAFIAFTTLAAFRNKSYNKSIKSEITEL